MKVLWSLYPPKLFIVMFPMNHNPDPFESSKDNLGNMGEGNLSFF